MDLFHVAYNGYVWKALFLYRHPERSRGIFLAHRYSAVCVIAENGNASRREQESAEKGNPSAKGARKSRVQGRFLAALEMTIWGNGFISRGVQRICLESAIPHNVIPSEVEGSFWHTGIASYVRQRKRGILLRKEQERAECKEDFSLRSK